MHKYLLNSKKIVSTIEVLGKRIEDRFPGSGLGEVNQRLHEIAKETDNTALWIEKPNLWLRCGLVFVLVIALGGVLYGIFPLRVNAKTFGIGDIVQISEAALNIIVVLGAVLVFLVSIEARAKRRKVIASINKLRSVAHVIDAHQLTKDPYVIAERAVSTEHSPKRGMSEYQLARYLDYCSEMLSLASKVGFLYVQKFNDHDSINAVNDLEALTTGLSRKVWQKIMIIQQSRAVPPAARGVAPGPHQGAAPPGPP
ncbi:MAG: hypothetical protein GY765_11980, partial [bacterium]|nr:hypothetical protein [bacterium]